MDQAAARAQEPERVQERESAALFSPVIGVGVTAMSFNDHVERIINLSMGPSVGGYVCVANVHMLVEARMRWEFREVLDSAHLVTPDGMPLVWMLRRNGCPIQERVAGMDLLPALCERASEVGVPVFLLGATEEVLEGMRARFADELPSLKIAGMHAPPFRPLTQAEDASLVGLINRSGARLVLVALGCPKQEQWMFDHRHTIRPIMVGLGAAFGVYAGMQRRAPVAMQRSGLEWLFRLAQEPKRLWKRYLVTNSRFLAYVVEEQLQSLLARVRSAEE